jgi:hypothetical protein
MRSVKALTSVLKHSFHSCHRRSTLTESLDEALEDSLPGGLSAAASNCRPSAPPQRHPGTGLRLPFRSQSSEYPRQARASEVASPLLDTILVRLVFERSMQSPLGRASPRVPQREQPYD